MHRLDVGEMTHALVPPGRVSDVAWLEGRTETSYIHSGRRALWLDDGEAAQVVALRPAAPS